MSSYGIHDRAVDNLCYLTSLDASLWDVTWRPIKDLAPYITQELADKVRDESSVPEAAPLDKVLSCYWTVKRRFQELEDWLDAYDEHLAKCRLTKEYFYQQWRATREEDITSFLDLCRYLMHPNPLLHYNDKVSPLRQAADITSWIARFVRAAEGSIPCILNGCKARATANCLISLCDTHCCAEIHRDLCITEGCSLHGTHD